MPSASNDVPHGWQMLVGLVPEANESLRDAADFAKRHWSAAAPFLQTEHLSLMLESTERVLARIAAMPPEARAEVSPAWLEQLRASPPTPWTHGFTILERSNGAMVGSCGFKGPPDADGVVEIAYGIEPAYRGRGYASECARAITDYALKAGARSVRAHTLPDNGASTRVLTNCGFTRLGDVMDPEDGLVSRWELRARNDD